MKKILSAILALVIMISAFSLTACKKNDGAPDDMRLVKGADDVGYYFYGPEEWVVANIGNIACTYASKVDTSSMTFVETGDITGDVKEYFKNEIDKFPYEITITTDGESCLFGADGRTATKYVYTYEYQGYSYSCMQIFVENGGRHYIFTYTAGNAEYKDGKSYFEFYLEKVTKSIENFKFVDKVPTDTPVTEYERDADGYILVSDKTLSGFNMYVPDSYKVDFSSVMVSVTHSDGTNMNMSTATYTGVTNEDYWNARKESLNAVIDKTQNENGEQISTLKEIKTAEKVTLSGVNWALAYEYTYTLDGVDYHVYQVLIVEGTVNGYVFTYVAEEDHYAEHHSEMQKVLEKITY